MKISFVIPTIDRFEYLTTCLTSLENTIKPDDIYLHLTIVDDASGDIRVQEYITNYHPKWVDMIDKVYKKQRTEGLCETNLKEIWTSHYNDNYDLFCNMDPDTIVNPNWLIELLNLHKLVETNKTISIVTPFHTHSHAIQQRTPKYIRKTTIGGICMLFNRIAFDTVIRPCLYPSSAWDWKVCSELKTKGHFYCTPVSYIEHIGKMSSARDSNLIPLFDRAIDFVGE